VITVSSPFYKGYATQYLEDDRAVNFTDATNAYFSGADMEYVSPSDENYVWMKRAFAYQRDSVQAAQSTCEILARN
jgi:hypothetical protein